MKKYLLALFLLFAGAAHADPILFFTDIVSGPKTGGLNNKGVWVTIYGNGFGATQGASTVTIGGGAVDNCPVWEDWLWYQRITCQLGASVATGNIVVTVGGNASNTIAFTVASGNIYFVDPVSGNDANDGSYAHPWAWCAHAVDSAADGDTIYQRAGTCSTEWAFGATLWMSGNSGTSGTGRRAYLGYPGEDAIIACNNGGSQCYDYKSTAASGGSSYWTFGELNWSGTLGTSYNLNFDLGDGNRFVGSKFHNAAGTCLVIDGDITGLEIWGNNIYHCWAPESGGSLDERGYGIYYGGYGTLDTVSTRWNLFNQDQLATNPPTTEINTVEIQVAGSGYAVNNIVDIIGQGGVGSGGQARITAVSGGVPTAISLETAGSGYITERQLTTTGGAGTGLTVNITVLQAYGTKGIQIYGHISGDKFKNFVIDSNQFRHFCREAIAMGGSDGPTEIFDVGNIQYITNNLFVNNGGCDSINSYSAIQIGSTNLDAQIINNTFYYNGNGSLTGAGSSTGDIYSNGVNHSILASNNIFYAPTPQDDYCGYICGTTTNWSGNTNVFYNFGNGPGFLTGNINGSDPLFTNATVDPADWDFHIGSSSPAKNGGTTLTVATPDMDGCNRPQNTTYGMGVFEYAVSCGGSPPPPPPGTTFYFRGHF